MNRDASGSDAKAFGEDISADRDALAVRREMDEAFFIIGPTASGKSDIAERLAPQIDAEIISLDSMSVYRGMDIGTAKPSPEVRRAIPHHLIDIIPPTREFSAAEYVGMAKRTARDIRARGKIPLFVGGTPLYVRLLLEGMFQGPPADPELRRELKRLADEKGGSGILHGRLAAVDPLTAQRLHPNDTKRIIRALEVYIKTGKPISELQRQWGKNTLLTYTENLAIIMRNRTDLKQRIRSRVDEMFRRGLVDEVEQLLASYSAISRTAEAAVGYAEVIAHVEQGVPIEETIERVKQRTWQVARKQLTWFRRFGDSCRLYAGSKELSENIVKRLYIRLRRWHNIIAVSKGLCDREENVNPNSPGDILGC